MKVSPYLNLNRIEFVVTEQCVGRCKHCSVSERLSEKHISAELAGRVVDELSAVFPITSVMTFGGEPLLYADVVCKIHRVASERGIAKRQIITSGFFTNDDARRREVAQALKNAGVSDVLISVDAFHQETISIEAVYSFAKYAKEADFSHAVLHPAWVVNERHINPYNTKTREILAEFSDLGLPVSDGNNIIMAGNAIEFLAQYYDPPTLDLSKMCGIMPYTDPLTDISSLSVVPNGDVMVCGAFSIGNLHKLSLKEIISQYDPHKNKWTNALLTGGAAAMLELAASKGIEIDTSQCRTVCDVCKKLTFREYDT
ncbi:MAG: radical SAM protein [Defluviitaleaceae bacterium]|nr:radical SAM protein [Defluviitaleaceae bacterium]